MTFYVINVEFAFIKRILEKMLSLKLKKTLPLTSKPMIYTSKLNADQRKKLSIRNVLKYLFSELWLCTNIVVFVHCKVIWLGLLKKLELPHIIREKSIYQMEIGVVKVT